jgi:hypothetical protein
MIIGGGYANRNKRTTQGYDMALTIIIVLGILQERLRDSKAAFGPGHPPASYIIGDYRPG